MTPAIAINSTTWTLRCKHHRTTLLLHVDPLQPLSSVRAELLKALQQTHPSGTLNGAVIPDHEADILLARQLTHDDLSLSWEALDQDNELGNADEQSAKGKGKVGGRAAKSNKLTDCPQGAGLRDGGVVAFKFRSRAARVMEDSDGEEQESLDGETLVGAPVAERWDVVVPTMEETYRDEEDEAVPVPLPRNAT
ncbi:hypothetical protein LTR08_001945 [Meristemomyces frigidus]|nr:hypothetical protein LTR08_001945 [Meristemomyces frigidus]